MQRQQALLASPVHAQTHKSAERKMQIVQCACTLGILILFVHICKSRHSHTHMYPLQSLYYHRVIPESWACLLVREYANQLKQKKKMTFSTSPHRLTNGQLSGCCVVVCYARVFLLVCMKQYVRGCWSHVCVCVRASVCVHLLLYLASNT